MNTITLYHTKNVNENIETYALNLVRKHNLKI